MKKVSVITLSLLTFLNSSLVFSASNRSFRRNASNNSIRSSSTTSVSSVDTSITTTDNTDTTSQTLTSVVDIVNTTSDYDDSNKAEVESAIKAVELKISEVKSECLGIKKDFDTLFGLNAATAVSSFLGTGASGHALITGVQKAKLDKLSRLAPNMYRSAANMPSTKYCRNERVVFRSLKQKSRAKAHTIQRVGSVRGPWKGGTNVSARGSL